MLPKYQMSEEDIKLNFITPALFDADWKGKIRMEVSITDGQVNIKGNKVVREKPKKADYVLYYNDSKPIAIVEAKDNNCTVSFGIQQANTYALMMDVPFAFSSNGDAFYEHDFLTGIERELQLDEFPTPTELINRYDKEANNGSGISDKEKKLINEPFYTSQTTYPPRYYQRNAVNRTLDAIAKGQNRILLAMATGTGKTYTAFQIVWRLLQSGTKRKVLYLADRNNLVDQSIQQDFAPLAKTIHKVNFAQDDSTTISSYEVYFSLYQQLSDRSDDENSDEDELEAVRRLSKLFNKDFFDLVIVDECHRGSAKADSAWRHILEYFSNATQIGMTATPKETKYISNIDYFGNPIYTYSLNEGIQDGFLAPFKVYKPILNISDGWRPCINQTDKNGNLIEDRIYNNKDFDYNIILEDRRMEAAKEITKYLKATDRMQKTIVFCATEEHADAMRNLLAQLNSDMVKQNPDYVVRITGSDPYGKKKLNYFTSVSEKYPVIATTSKLLSTGTDCKMVKLIVLDQMIGSMTEFKQIIGRGTRLREKEGKMYFSVLDFRNVSRLFDDPGWDGPIVVDPDYPGTASTPKDISTPPQIPSPPRIKPIVDKEGCKVEIFGKTVSIYDVNGKLLKQESVIDYTKMNLLGDYLSLDDFIHHWTSEEKKIAIKNILESRGIDLDDLKNQQDMSDVDDFDFICHIAFDQKPLTRQERANNVKKKDFLSKYNGIARDVLDALIDRYADYGIYEIENTDVLKLEPFSQYGKPLKIAQLFGGKDGYLKAIHELEKEIYGVA